MPPVKFDIKECLKKASPVSCVEQLYKSGWKPPLKHYIPATRFGRHRSAVEYAEVAICAFVAVAVITYVAYRYYQRTYGVVSAHINPSYDLESQQPLQNENQSMPVIPECIEIQEAVDIHNGPQDTKLENIRN